MRFPTHITTDMVKHQFSNAVQGNKRYPFVLMLEPLYTCNLACIGCAVERHTGKLKDRCRSRRVSRRSTKRAPSRIDLRWRADGLSRAARTDRRHHRPQAPHLLCAPTLFCWMRTCSTRSTPQAADDQCPPRRYARDPRLRLRSRGVFDKAIEMIREQDARLPRDDQHHDLQGDVDRGGRRALPVHERSGCRWHADLARLPVRVGENDIFLTRQDIQTSSKESWRSRRTTG